MRVGGDEPVRRHPQTVMDRTHPPGRLGMATLARQAWLGGEKVLQIALQAALQPLHHVAMDEQGGGLRIGAQSIIKAVQKTRPQGPNALDKAMQNKTIRGPKFNQPPPRRKR